MSTADLLQVQKDKGKLDSFLLELLAMQTFRMACSQTEE
jgi:hypothetical protein